MRAWQGVLLRVGRMIGVTSTRRAAILALVVCAIAMSVTVPLQNYLGQRAAIAEVHANQELLADQVVELQHRRALLANRHYVEAQARERLGYVYPGETPYMVQLPNPPTAASGREHRAEPSDPWYIRLWRSITGHGG